MTDTKSHKANAVTLLTTMKLTVEAMAASRDRDVMLVDLMYIREEVALIDELKRPRKSKPAATKKKATVNAPLSPTARGHVHPGEEPPK